MGSMPQRTQKPPSREVTMDFRDSAFELCALVVDGGIFKKSKTRTRTVTNPGRPSYLGVRNAFTTAHKFVKKPSRLQRRGWPKTEHK
jgi:hypothetical protein